MFGYVRHSIWPTLKSYLQVNFLLTTPLDGPCLSQRINASDYDMYYRVAQITGGLAVKAFAVDSNSVTTVKT